MKRQFDGGVDVDVATESDGDPHVVASLLVLVFVSSFLIFRIHFFKKKLN